MTVWLLCFAAFISGDHDVMSLPTTGTLMTPEAAFVRMREAPAEGLICAPYSENGEPVALTIMVDTPSPARLRMARP